MNAPILTPIQDRIAQREAVEAAQIKRLIEKLEARLERMSDQWRRVEAIDAARYVWPDADDLERLFQTELFELGLTEDGFRRDDDNACTQADRVYSPMARVEAVS